MSNLRYASANADGTRLYDSVEDRYFITERLAVEKLNLALERAAKVAEGSDEGEWSQGFVETETDLRDNLAMRIRALKENV